MALGPVLGPPAPPPPPPHDRTVVAALTLVGLSILIPELLTGSTPVLDLIVNPISGLFLLGLYGCGVLLIREFTVRFGKGWPTVLLLGAAYGILEEGPGTKTFFDPRATSAAGAMTHVGHVLGVSWVWVVFITVFHAVFSIGLPILLTQLAYPETNGQPLVRVRTTYELAGCYAITVLVMYFLFDGAYKPSAPVLSFFLGVVALLAYLAYQAPERWTGWVPVRPLLTPGWVGTFSGLWVFLWFGIFWLGSSANLDPIFLVVAGTLWCWAIGVVLVQEFERGDPHTRLTFATGLLSFLIMFSVVVTFVGDYLAPIATILIVWFLYRLRVQLPPDVPALVSLPPSLLPGPPSSPPL
jgi:hypothetical protein